MYGCPLRPKKILQKESFLSTRNVSVMQETLLKNRSFGGLGGLNQIFFPSGSYFTDIDDSQDSRGR